jgi:hypothetical protein
VDTKPWNAYYERPATLYLLDNGADVMAIDVNKNDVNKSMVEITKKKNRK